MYLSKSVRLHNPIINHQTIMLSNQSCEQFYKITKKYYVFQESLIVGLVQVSIVTQFLGIEAATVKAISANKMLRKN